MAASCRSVRRRCSGLRMVCALVAIVGCHGFAQAADRPPAPSAIARKPLSTTPTSLLNGRLTIRLPEGAKIEARPVSVMSAPESDEDETRVVLDAGEERLVVMVHELFGLASDDFERDVRLTVAGWGDKAAQYRFAHAPLKGVRAIAVLPAPGSSQETDAVFVRGLFVALPDGTVQTVFVYVNPRAARDHAGCSAAAERILATLAPGPRRLQLDAGKRTLATLSPDAEIVVTVPKNIVVTTQNGPDFVVQRLKVVGWLGKSSDMIGFYLGHHPSFEKGEKRADGTLFGKKVVWQARREGRGLEALVSLPRASGPPDYAHVWIIATSDDRLAALKTIAESMKLAKKPSPAGAAR